MTATPKATELQALLEMVEAGEGRMRNSDTANDWGQGYTLGSAETYGLVAHWLRAMIATQGEKTDD